MIDPTPSRQRHSISSSYSLPYFLEHRLQSLTRLIDRVPYLPVRSADCFGGTLSEFRNTLLMALSRAQFPHKESSQPALVTARQISREMQALDCMVRLIQINEHIFQGHRAPLVSRLDAK